MAGVAANPALMLSLPNLLTLSRIVAVPLLVALLARVRDSYHRLAADGWVTIDASLSRDEVAARVGAVVDQALARR